MTAFLLTLIGFILIFVFVEDFSEVSVVFFYWFI